MKAKSLDFTGFLQIIQLTKNNIIMKKTDFDTCHRPSFLFWGFFDALYTPIWGGFDVCIALLRKRWGILLWI